MITGEEALHLARKELGKIKDAIMLSVSNFVSNLTASINTVANNLSAEISARQSADSSLQSGLNSCVKDYGRVIGATDINTVKNTAISLSSQHGYNKFFTFRVDYDGSSAKGTFGSSSFSVICCLSSVNYGYGIMISDNKRNVAGFYVSAGTIYETHFGTFAEDITTAIGLTSSYTFRVKNAYKVGQMVILNFAVNNKGNNFNIQSGFSARVNPLCSITKYKPVAQSIVIAGTSTSVNAVTSGTAAVYIQTNGNILSDMLTSNVKEISVAATYMTNE